MDREKSTAMPPRVIVDLRWPLARITIKGASKTIEYRSEPHRPKNQRAIIRKKWMEAYQTKRRSGLSMRAHITSTTFTIIPAEEKRESVKSGGFNHGGKKSGTGGPCKKWRSLPGGLSRHLLPSGRSIY